MPKEPNDNRIIASWHKNAGPWIDAVRAGRIESRRRATDQAIVDAVLDGGPRSVLDIGCGEGWLLRVLADHGIRTVGVDGIADLVESARSSGCGDVRLMRYDELAAGRLDLKIDAVVCNFSLIGGESVEGVIAAVPSLLNPGGALIIQTLHPLMVCGDHPYRDGWRDGSWVGFGDAFSEPAPWYFRTLESWVELLSAQRLRISHIREPLHPDTGRPASIVFVAGLAG